MAEAAGLAFGVVGLWTTFNSCVELAEQIKDARSLGKDYELKITTLMLLEQRLKNCHTKRVLQQDLQQQTGSDDSNEYKLAARALAAIQLRLRDVGELLNKYDKHRRQDQLTQISTGTCQGNSLQETTEYMMETSLQRQQAVSFWLKTCWAVSDRKALERAIAEIEGFVTQLEKLSEDTNSTVAFTWPGPSAGVHGTSEALEARRVPTNGHIYHQNNISGRARVTQGDVGPGAHLGAKNHVYIGNNITGDARVLQGNTSITDMRGFWDD